MQCRFIIIVLSMFFIPFNVWAHDNSVSKIRCNKFVFDLPEFSMKAEVKVLSAKNATQEDTSEVRVADVLFRFPKAYAEKVKFMFKSTPSAKVTSEHGLVLIQLQKGVGWGCENEAFKKNNLDFCSETTSMQDFYYKLYTMTPKDCLDSIGKSWIVWRKGIVFENSEKIVIYKVNNFTAFVRVVNGLRVRIICDIFHDQFAPNTFINMFTDFKDIGFLEDVLSTLKLLDD